MRVVRSDNVAQGDTETDATASKTQKKRDRMQAGTGDGSAT